MANRRKGEVGERKRASLIRAGNAFNAVGMPADASGKLPVITLSAGRFLRVAHHRGILVFTPSCVRLYSALGIIRITGEELVSTSLDGNDLILEGKIKCIAFE
ncbi:MAG: YabP/YqfC family sporulation protein [Clostridiales bacterium]|nr:YabP/YqfC family sporulation protein [Clostridiales bacterium]